MSPSAETKNGSVKGPITPFLKSALDINKLSLEKLQIREKEAQPYEFDYLTPAFPDLKWAPLEKFDYVDKAANADPEYKELFKDVTSYHHLTPKIGTVLEGVNLAKLNDKQKEELAHLIAYRGVVFFRDQTDLDIHAQLELGRFWGKLHKHATTALPKGWKEQGLEEIHVVYTDDKKAPNQAYSQSSLWHSDVSYEVQPPSYTTLKLIDGPETGGDTLWVSGSALYDSLSPGLKEYVEKHTALHSAHEQANGARASGTPVRREPIISEHPLVRVHPITGYKSLYINPGFTRSIVGVPKAESEAILNYLFSLLVTAQEYVARFKWEKHSVAAWDNRNTTHTASYGFYPNRRHAVRVTVHGEVPYYDKNGISEQEAIDQALGLKSAVIDGSKGSNYND